MKIARTNPDEIQTVVAFLRDLESILTHRLVVDPETCEETPIVTPIELENWLYERFEDVETVWSRVLTNCSALYEHCCDHELPHLEWPPHIKAFLESQPESEAVDG